MILDAIFNKNNTIAISEYVVQSNEICNSYKMAVVADLHEREFLEIISILNRISPDFIFLPGDTLERRDEGVQGYTKDDIKKKKKTSLFWKVACEFIWRVGLNHKNDNYAVSGNGLLFLKEISSIAPVVMSVGNHEWYFTKEDTDCFNMYRIAVVDNTDTIINTDCGEYIRIGGLSTRYDMNWLHSFSQKEGFKILLCHHPEYYQQKIYGTEDDVFDVVVSGHAHGGQVRFLGRGLFSPGQGLFPKYTKGMVERHIISAGVSNTAFFPRWGNPKELIVINIEGK